MIWIIVTPWCICSKQLKPWLRILMTIPNLSGWWMKKHPQDHGWWSSVCVENMWASVLWWLSYILLQQEGSTTYTEEQQGCTVDSLWPLRSILLAFPPLRQFSSSAGPAMVLSTHKTETIYLGIVVLKGCIASFPGSSRLAEICKWNFLRMLVRVGT